MEKVTTESRYVRDMSGRDQDFSLGEIDPNPGAKSRSMDLGSSKIFSQKLKEIKLSRGAPAQSSRYYLAGPFTGQVKSCIPGPIERLGVYLTSLSWRDICQATMVYISV